MNHTNINSKLPRHIAISAVCSSEVANQLVNINNLIKTVVGLKIPMITLQFSGDAWGVDTLMDLFTSLQAWSFIEESQIKVSVLGKWYDTPSRLVDPIKNLLEKTKDYDRFFLNFCINYDGQEEIVDACRLVAKQVQLQKLDSEQINKNAIKENLYSSTLLPPDLIIKTGFDKRIGDLLLWDCAYARIYFAGKYWEEFTEEDFLKALDRY